MISTIVSLEPDEDYTDYEKLDFTVPFRGYRPYVAGAYILFNTLGFLSNIWVMYVVAPLICTKRAKVPLSILFYILTLCICDLMIMLGMLGLIIDIVHGNWKFSYFSCVCYLIFDSMNKFVAPIIVVLISRTCYLTICGNVEQQGNAGQLKLQYAIVQVLFAMLAVAAIVWPVGAYSVLHKMYHSPNETTMQVRVIRKCSFQPPPEVELGFSIVGIIFSYAIPLGGIIYWFVSVPFFLRKRANQSLVNSSSGNAAIKRVVRTVLVLTVVYVFSWTPYWISLVSYRFFPASGMNRTLVIISYFVHLLPYISCCAYPVIFTTMNRGITDAHAKIVDAQRRRIKSITGDATMQIRQAYRNSMPILRRNSAGAARRAKMRLRSYAGFPVGESTFGERLMGEMPSSDVSAVTRHSVETVVHLLSSTADINCQKKSFLEFSRRLPIVASGDNMENNAGGYRLRRTSSLTDQRLTIARTMKTVEWGPETLL